MTTRLCAGAARAPIDLAGLLPVDGFDVVLDPLHVRALVLEHPSRRVALIVIEMTSLPSWAVERIRHLVSARVCCAPDDVVVGASHTFSAPHLLPEPSDGHDPLFASLAAAVRDAAGCAVHRLTPAQARFGRGRCQIAVNRDVPTPHGWWLGTNQEGTTDDDVPVLRLDSIDGAPLALVTSYAVQSSVLDGARTSDGRRPVSADLLGAACRHAEAALGSGVVTLALIGAGGDQAPARTMVRRTVDEDGGARTVAVHDADLGPVDEQGRTLADAIVAVADVAVRVADEPLAVVRRTVTVPAQAAPLHHEDLRPTRAYRFVPEGNVDVPITLLLIGDARIIGVQAELNAATGRAIKALAPDIPLIVATMVDGAAKYMADAASYDRITYEAMNSHYARGAAEALVKAMADPLNNAPGELGYSAD